MLSKIWLLTLVVLIGLNASSAYAGKSGPQVTQHMAIHHNTALLEKPESTVVSLQYYLVPRSWVKILADDHLPKAWQDLVSDVDHPGYFKLPIHAYDLYTGPEVERLLKLAGYPIVKGTLAPLFLTESRSLYPIESKMGEPTISQRLSMTHGLGKWGGIEKDDLVGSEDMVKLITGPKAQFALEVSQLVQETIGGVRGKYFEIQPERMVAIIAPPEQRKTIGITFRDIESVNRPGRYAVPGFSVIEGRASLSLALLNGFTDEEKFVEELDGPIRGRAWAEFIMTTGFVHSSPHSQNLLQETDEFMRLKGVMLIRDLPDLVPTVWAMNRNQSLRNLFTRYYDERDGMQRGLEGTSKHLLFRTSYEKGNHFPGSILNGSERFRFDKSVLNNFIKALSEMSGVPIDEVQLIAKSVYSQDYFQLFVSTDGPIWNKVEAGIENYKSHHDSQTSRPKTVFSGNDDETLKALSLLKMGKFESLPVTFPLLRAALIAKIQGYILPDLLLEKIHNEIDVKKIKSDKNPAWTLAAALTLDALNPEIIPDIYPLLESSYARELALEILMGKGSPDANTRALILFTNKNGEAMQNYQWNVSKLAFSRTELQKESKFLEALYFFLKAKGEELSFCIKFQDHGSLPDSILKDLATSEVEREVWFRTKVLENNPRAARFLREARKNLNLDVCKKALSN